MKSLFKHSAIAAAMLLAQQASAVDIVITGSTAFRSATHSGIANMMTGETVAHSHATSLNSANQSTFKGTIAGISGTVYVYCSWSGSATGVIAVANSTPVSVITAGQVDALTAGTTNAAISPSSTMVPRMAFSDVYKESTTAASAALTDSRPAVIPFRFLKNRGSSASLTNVTAQQVRSLWNNNSVPLGLFTGNIADTSKVIGLGRDNGSGTRITVLAETKYGIGNLVQQWKTTTTGTAGTDGVVTKAQIWGVGDGVGSTTGGNGGYSSGSFIAAAMGCTSNGVDLFEEDGTTLIDTVDVTMLAWLGLSDTNVATGTGATALPYEGVNYTANAVYNGSYTLWGYLHLYYPTLTTDENTFRTGLNTQLANSSVLGSNGLVFNLMQCARTSDGGIVSANY